MAIEKSYFCPDCGWEGTDALCAICGSPTESLTVDPTTGKVIDDESLGDDLADDLCDDLADEEIDVIGETIDKKHTDKIL